MEGEFHRKLDSFKAHWRNKAQSFGILEEGMWFSELVEQLFSAAIIRQY
jgi:hypothetical protein